MCVGGKTDMWTNLNNRIMTKTRNCESLEECGACICVTYLLGFEDLPLPQILRNEDSHLPFTFTSLLPQRQSEDDDYRGKHQQEETFLTVTAISASVISIRLLLRNPWGLANSLQNMILNTTSTPKPNAFSHELITCKDCLLHMPFWL